MPFARHDLKCLANSPLLGRRVQAVGNQLARAVETFACLGQRDVRIDTEGEGLLLAVETVVESPVATTVRKNLQEQPVSVREAPWARPGFGCAYPRIGKHLMVSPCSPVLVPTNVPTNR